MNFSSWSIRQPIPSILFFILFTMAGLMSYPKLMVQNFPDMDTPTVTVTINYPGATASQLETEITRKIEDSVANIGSVDHVTSVASEGASITTIQFVLEKDINEAVNDVTDAIAQIRSDLPSDSEEPIIARVSVTGGAVVTYAVSSDNLQADELSWFIDNDISKAVLGVAGVGKVSRIGGIEREISIEVKPQQLESLGVTMADISTAIHQMQQDVPSGSGRIGELQQSIRTVGTIDDLNALKSLYIPLANGRKIRLDRLADIRDGSAEPSTAAFLNGKSIISFEVYRSRGASEVNVANGVAEVLDKLMTKNKGVSITFLSTTVTQIEESYDASMSVLYEGALLAVLVVLIFLKDWRATAISALALPLSIIPTFAMMYWFGFSLNVVTLLALTLVVGILVDDAIVEIENIVRHLRMGKKPINAATDAAEEIGMAVIATTFTLIAVFLPTAFMSGISGMIFKQFGWTAVLSIFFSLLVARFLTPMMAAYFLKPTKHIEKESKVMEYYLHLATWCLKHRGKTMLMVMAFLVGSAYLATFMTTSFIPSQEKGQITVSIELPPGTRIDHTIETSDKTYHALKDIEGIKSVYTAIGASSAGDMGTSTAGEIRKATMLLDLVNKKDRKLSEFDIEDIVRDKLRSVAGARFSLGAGGSGEKVSIVLAGDNEQDLNTASQTLTTQMRAIEGLSNIVSTASLLTPEIIIKPDFAKASAMGVTSQDIGRVVRVATNGDYDASVAKFNLPEKQLYVRVKLPAAARGDLEILRNLRVPSGNTTVSLGSIADISISSAPAEINRFDRQRNITISAELGGMPLGDVTKKINALAAMQNLPTSVESVESDDLEMMNDMFGSFGLAMLTAVFCMMSVLILLFKDFLQPVTILSALPLSAGGAIGLLVATGYGLSLPTLIGLLMLMGIVTKNSILLVEYAIVTRLNGKMSRLDALLDACHKRAQPILMTTIAMIAGMIPIALGLHGDASFRAPMAVAVIGGLITSTLLSLIVVPVIYTYVDDFEEWIRGLFSKKEDAETLINS